MQGLIRTVKQYPSKVETAKHAFLLCGFGGSIWQLRRLIRALHKEGYNVTALDFAQETLSKGDVSLLPRLMDQTMALVEAKAKHIGQPILLVGVSLGALLSLNLLRRSPLFDKAVLITGGDIATVARRLYPDKWPQSYDELAKTWESVNMYSQPETLAGKRAIMILPTRDRLIDPEQVRQEIVRQQVAGNDVQLVERRTFGHVGTIIEEAVLLPHRTKSYIRRIGGD